jgi:hypothetical protein
MGCLTLCDTKPESAKPSSCSKVFVNRQAWALQSGASFLQAIENGTPIWTLNPSKAMSWLDPNLALQRLRMIPGARKLLPAASLVSLRFQAQIGTHPLKWRHCDEETAV